MNVKPLAMRDALLERIWQAMSTENIFFVSADFGSPVLDKIRSDFPDRFVNVGIAEQNLINISAGLALEGYKVFAYAIAPFITMRCFEQIRVSLALLSEVRPMNVNLIGVGAGYSYVVSGPTHQCYEDITLMRALPNVSVFSPADHISAASLIDKCLNETKPKYLRFDAQPLPVVYEDKKLDLDVGFFCHKEGHEVCLLATGYMLHIALQAADILAEKGIKIGVVDVIDLKNLSERSLAKVLSEYNAIVSLEEGFKGRGGLDSLIITCMLNQGLQKKFLNLGVNNHYSFELGTRNQIHEQVGIGPNSVANSIQNFYISIKEALVKEGVKADEISINEK